MVGLDQKMSSSPNRGSKAAGTNSRPSSKDGSKKNIWSSLLDGVANGKRLPEKNLLILGPCLSTLALAPLGFVAAFY
jgi:dynein light intermediate chain 1